MPFRGEAGVRSGRHEDLAVHGGRDRVDVATGAAGGRFAAPTVGGGGRRAAQVDLRDGRAAGRGRQHDLGNAALDHVCLVGGQGDGGEDADDRDDDHQLDQGETLLYRLALHGHDPLLAPHAAASRARPLAEFGGKKGRLSTLARRSGDSLSRGRSRAGTVAGSW